MATITHSRQLGAAIRDERLRRGLTQAELASDAGVSRAWLAKFETGHRTASLDQFFMVLRSLSLALEVTTPRMTQAEAEVLAAFDESERR